LTALQFTRPRAVVSSAHPLPCAPGGGTVKHRRRHAAARERHGKRAQLRLLPLDRLLESPHQALEGCC
jgi:hypothetical protein